MKKPKKTGKKRKRTKRMSGKNFSELFAKQMLFQIKVERMPIVDDPIKFQYHMNAMTEELGEVLKADKRWKTHRNTTFNPEEKLDELSDCFITLMNVVMWSGFTSRDILEAIDKKIEENNFRIEGEIQ